MNRKAGKKDKSINLLILALIAGMCLMIYPSLANFINQRTATQAIATYSEDVVKIKPEDYSKMLDAAKEYNKRLAKVENPLARFEQVPGYNELLNIGGTGIMGVITIGKINVELPIYHGTSDDILNVAVGHLQGSSLPIGGKDTHAVLTGHRGLPSARLFTDLDQLQEGDTFTITVLDQTVTYTVDQIRIVQPTNIEDLKIVPGEDYVTLMTCTPYGINTHRLLVRGTRTSNA
ncbi:MAG: class C sortase, partial [Erysipelotrichaceae bacterium]|nr:class C sortase [Erysipelotrichaceae bacterium]